MHRKPFVWGVCASSSAIRGQASPAAFAHYTIAVTPIEQVWPEVRHDFKNKLFHTLNDVIDQLCLTLNSLTKQMIKSITARDWILRMF